MKIGIITMHQVLNSGSALQAYALQRKISELGFEAEIIDYQFHNHKVKSIKELLNRLLTATKRSKFRKFYDKYFNLSKRKYNKESIKQNPPDYDIYCTGSDQVWNPRFIANDTNFMLSFAPDNKPRFSFAASFTTGEIPEKYIPLYKEHLSKYKFISVREQSGVRIIQQLLDREADLVCDPTLLLNDVQWSELVGKKQNHEKYILVYVLGYMFNVRPKVYDIIEKVQNELGYKVYYLNSSIKREYSKKNKKLIINYSPEDFINYFKNASFVITDSFHGTVFSAIFNKPVLSVVEDKCNAKDGRISTLLKEIGGEQSLTEYNKVPDFKASQTEMYKVDQTLLEKYRNRSVEILGKMLGCL